MPDQQEGEYRSGSNGHGPTATAPDGEERMFHFASNPGRRHGERWNVRLPHGAEAKRLYGREARQEPPAPDDLRSVYADALRLIGHYRPLRAAYLDHLIGRTAYAFRRYCAARAENDARHQNANEEARSADEWLDNRIGQLRAERDGVAEDWRERVEGWRDALAGANEEAAAAHTASGHPMPYQYRGREDEAAPPAGVSAGAQVADAFAQAIPAVAAAAGSVATQSARTAGTVRGLLQRLSGGLKFRAQAPATAAPAVPDTEAASVDPSRPVRPPRPAYPGTVPFPLADGEEQAMPLEAIATQQGLPSHSPMAAAMESRERHLTWLALVACGSIFGASLGFLIGLVNLNMFHFAQRTAILTMAGLCSLGVFMFWVLGRVVFGVAAAASEDRHLHLVASHRDDPARVGDWLRRAAGWSLGALLLISAVLVAVEAVVERYGVISTFVSANFNDAVASGKVGAASGGLDRLALIFMVLTVSLPFVLLHMAHGWAFARNRAITGHLRGLRMKQAWEIATRCHADRTQRVAALFEQERAEQDEAWRKTEEEAERARREAQTAQTAAAAGGQAEVPVAGVEAEVGLAPAPSEGPADTAEGSAARPFPVFLDEEPLRRSDVARKLAAAWEAEQRWRRVRRSRSEALEWYDQRIAQYEAERQREAPGLPADGGEWEKSAYEAFERELRSFEECYQKEVRAVEKMMRLGLLVRLWQALMRREPPYTVRYTPRP